MKALPKVFFIDTEFNPSTKKVLDLGAFNSEKGGLHSSSFHQFEEFIGDAEFIAGHNIIEHDLKILDNRIQLPQLKSSQIIDTLYWSPILFPTKPYHRLIKDDMLDSEDRSNPLNDAKKAAELLNDEIDAFKELDEEMQIILCSLLNQDQKFKGFFHLLKFTESSEECERLIQKRFKGKICKNADLQSLITRFPVELAYSLALIDKSDEGDVHPPWVVKTYLEIDRIYTLIRGIRCLTGCEYCNLNQNVHRGLKNFFGFDEFRSFNGRSLQEEAVQAAVDNKSLLAIFPTGGGKSLTFQLPALMAGRNKGALTVVISPLQSLMKDQVDNLEDKGVTSAATINGQLDPIQRKNAFERVKNGSASILYISPEALRSRSIERLLLGRRIERFVIDEAHCFSSWGQDFRVDYLNIGDFIRSLCETKNRFEMYPVSCFTATAKPQVIEDIRSYFKEKLNIELELFTASTERKNLHYQVMKRDGDEEKYQALRDLLSGMNDPAIVYVARTRKTEDIAERLVVDGFSAQAYHGKMKSDERIAAQNAFMENKVQVMVATTAFGMGVDKDNVRLVVHFDISDSLENYVQEAGRAGRDQKLDAECIVLYSEEDISKHFTLLNQTKLSRLEIQQVWRAIKKLTAFRKTVSNSALEIARAAGWDDRVDQIETRVRTAIAALENAGYVNRGMNSPRVYATGILAENLAEANDKIHGSLLFSEKQKEYATRIMKMLISSKRKSELTDEAESRVDYISDRLGIPKEDIIEVIRMLKEEKILDDGNDLKAFIPRDGRTAKRRSLERILQVEKLMIDDIHPDDKIFEWNVKELHQIAESEGVSNTSVLDIRKILGFWSIKNYVKQKKRYADPNRIKVRMQTTQEALNHSREMRLEACRLIYDTLIELAKGDSTEEQIEFSLLGMLQQLNETSSLFDTKFTASDVEDALLYLQRIDVLNIEGGFLVLYNSMEIKRLEMNNRIDYKVEDYQDLEEYYKHKVEQIHIVGEYAEKMVKETEEALSFVNDYFEMDYRRFLSKYFNPQRRKELRLTLTPAKFKQLFGELSPRQLEIVKDKNSSGIAVLAGPGSGKTKLLVHKLAALLLMEDVKQEQLLMLTFSRAAASEFKIRLRKLIGKSSDFVEIKTFHSYAFDLLGLPGSDESFDKIVEKAVHAIEQNEVERNRITKTVLVVDEAQDMDEYSYQLITSLWKNNDDMRMILVGDDDQNIYKFRGSDSKYLQRFVQSDSVKKYELIENFRSSPNLVSFSNQFVQLIHTRLKTEPIRAVIKEKGNISNFHSIAS